MQGDKYLGRWALIPELSLYEEGEPPNSGIYELVASGDGIQVSIEWVAADGSSHATAFAGPCDGSRQELSQPGVTHFAITRVDERTLDSSAFRDGAEIAYARRRASSDGDLLATVQEGRRPDGTTFRNFQVYRRLS
jgi:hypothetical protein